MNEFDLTNYLSNRAGSSGSSTSVEPKAIPELDGYDKIYEVEKAAKEKIARLDALNLRDQKRREVAKQSSVGMLDLDPEGLTGTVVNSAVGAGASVSRLTGQVGSGIWDLLGAATNQHMPQEVKDARARQLQGKATQADEALLALPSGLTEMPKRWLTEIEAYQLKNSETNGQRIQRMEKSFKNAKDVREFFDLSNRVHQGNKDRTIDSFNAKVDQADVVQMNAGLDKLNNGEYLAGAKEFLPGFVKAIPAALKAGIENPMGAVDMVVDQTGNLLSMAAGAPVAAAANLLYGVDSFGQGVQAHLEDNKGAIPSDKEFAKKAALAGSAVLAETVGDKLTGVTKLAKGFGKAAEKATEEVTQEAARTGLKETLKNALTGANDIAPTRIAKAGLEGAVGEYATEGYQTWAEEAMKGHNASAEKILEGAAMGAIAGAGMSGGAHAAHEVASATVSGLTKAADVVQDKVGFKDAVETNNAEAYLNSQDPKSYDPVKAAKVLYTHTRQEGVSEDVKTGNGTKLDDLIARLENDRDTYLEQTPEGRSLVEDRIAKLEAEAAKASQEDAAPMLEMVQFLREGLDANTSLDPKVVKGAQSKIGEIDSQLETIKKLRQRMVEDSLKGADLNTVLSEADTDISSGDQEIVAKAQKASNVLINLAMSAPQRVTPEILTKMASLAQNTSNGLSASQRSYLSAYTAARIAENRLKDGGKVHQEVLQGDPAKGQMGILQYNQGISQALTTGSQKTADRLLRQLNNFVSGHAQKADQFEAWYKEAQQTGQPIYVQPVENQGWVRITDPVEDKAARDKAGIIQIGRGGPNAYNSGKLVEAVRKESDALVQTQAALQQAYSLKFNSQSTKTSSAQGSAPQSTQSTQSTPVNSVDSQATAVAPSETATTPSNQYNGESTVNTVEEATREQSSPADSTTTAADTEAPAEAVETVQEVSEPAAEPVSNGKLSVFKEFKQEYVDRPLNAIYRQANLVAQFFKQKGESVRYKSQRPLSAIANFLSAWRNDPALVQQYLDPQQELTPEQAGALDHLKKTLAEWAPEFQKQFVAYSGHPDFRHQDMFSYLLTVTEGKADTDENVKTALAYAAYHWILMKATSPANLDSEQILQMHSRDKDDVLAPGAEAFFKRLHSFEDMAVHELGSVAMEVLGLTALDTAPKDLLPKLQTSMGLHILNFLEAQGFVERKTYPAKEVLARLDGESAEDSQDFGDLANFHYVSFKFNEDGTRTDLVEPIHRANTGTSNIIEKLFKTERATRMADTAPKRFEQKFAKNTRQLVSKAQAQVIDAVMQIPHKAIPEMFSLVDVLGRDMVLRIAGAKDVDSPNIHAINRDSIQAQNDNLANQFDLAMEMLNQTSNPDGYDTEFFVEGNVWRNFRAGFLNQSLNQQTSKIHRALFARPSWTAKIKLDDTKMVDEFKIAVAMNLGLVKTDQQPNAESLAKFAEALDKDPKVLLAANAIRERVLHDNDAAMTSEARQAIEAVVGKEGMLALQSLLAYAKYLDAVASNAESLEVTLLVGADGKTNGPMLTHLALGAASDLDGLYVLLNRGGMYREGEAEHFSQWYTGEEAMDLYEDLADSVLDVSTQRIRTAKEIMAMHQKNKNLPSHLKDKRVWNYFTQEVFDAFQMVTGKLTTNGKVNSKGRNLVKTPLTSFNFGSALSKSILNMENKFIEGIYSKLEEISAGKGDVTLPDFLKALNTLIERGDYKAPRINPKASIDVLMQNELTRYEPALRKAFQVVMGKPTHQAMQSYFAVLIGRRNSVNRTVQAAYTLYDQTYQTLRNAEMDRLMESGELPYREDPDTGKRTPMSDLTTKQEQALEARLADLLPVVHSDYSQRENNLKAGIMLVKSELSGAQSPLYKAQTKVAQKGKKTKNESAKPMVYTSVNPGVAALAYMMHSSDSAIMHKAIPSVPGALNVHDEISTGVQDIAKAAEAINGATVDTFLHYSPARQVAQLLERLTISLAAKVAKGEVDAATVKRTFDAWADIYNRSLPADEKISGFEASEMMMDSAIRTAFAADKLRLEAIANMAVMDQYTWEGGQFKVTEEIRQQAKDMLAKLSEQPSARFQEAMDYLASVYEGNAEVTQKFETWQDSYTDTTPEVDADPKAENAADMGIPGVVANEALDMVAELLPEVVQQVEGGKGVVEAVQSLPAQEQPKAIEALAKAGRKLMKDVTLAWGRLGQPKIKSDPALVVAFQAKPEMTANEVLALLKAQGKMGNFQTMVFGMVARALEAQKTGNTIKFKWVTPETPVDSILDKPGSQSRGWYVVKNGLEEVYVLSPDFEGSGLTTETLLHELVHTSLAKLVHRVQNPEPGYQASAEAVRLVKELEYVRVQVQDYVVKNKLFSKYRQTFENVDELIAWGMTNRGFQNDVLKKVQIRSKQGGNKLVTAMKEFVGILTRLVFPNATARQENALGVLIQDVSGLYSEAWGEMQADRAEINRSQASPTNTLTTLGLFDALGQTSSRTLAPEFNNHLRGLLAGIVETIHGWSGTLTDARMANPQGSAVDVWNQAKADQVVPFAAEALTSGFAFSDQEAFVAEQVEATVRAVLDRNDSQTTAAYTQLQKLYQEVRQLINRNGSDFYNGDWATATQAEKDEAKALHDFIFKTEKSQGDLSDYLARFATMGLTHEGFNQILQRASARLAKPGDQTMLERLNYWFHKVTGWIAGKLTHTYEGQPMDEKLSALVNQLVKIESLRREGTATPVESWLRPLEEGIKNTSQSVKDRVGKWGESDFFQNSKNGFVRLTGTIATTIAKDRAEYVMERLQRWHNQNVKDRDSMIGGIIREARGTNAGNMVLHMLHRATKHLEGQRKETITQTAKLVLGSFDKGGKDLTQEQKRGLSALLRIDLASLMDTHSMRDIQRLVNSLSETEKEITGLESRLGHLDRTTRNLLINQSKVLAYYLATGKVTGSFMMMNATNIAHLVGTPHAGRLTTQEANQLTPIIDQLVTLYGLSYLRTDHRIHARSVMNREQGRGTESGFEMMLRLHKDLQRQSKEQLFQGSERLMAKGYLPETYNPHREIIVADVVQGIELVAMGYRKGAKVDNDPHDPDQTERHIYLLPFGGLRDYSSGAVSLKGMGSKGSRAKNAEVQSMDEWKANRNDLQTMTRAKVMMRDMAVDPSQFDPAKVKRNHAVPVLDPNGSVTDYRYLMRDQVKDNLLERDNRFEQLLGKLAGSIFDKATAPEQNRKIIEALYNQYDEEFGTMADSYVFIGKDASEPEYAEIYQMLPEHTKQAIKEIWGMEGLHIRIDLIDVTFGYRKASLTQLFEKDYKAKYMVDKLFIQFINQLFGDKAKMKVGRIEAGWREVVQEAKDILVIRSFSVLKNNIFSNVSELVLAGVPLKDIFYHHRIALKAALDYRRDHEELMNLKSLLSMDYVTGNRQEMEERILQLEDALARNPVKPLIDEGLMPTIVEDVEGDDDLYSYKSHLKQNLERYTSKLNPKVKAAGEVVYMARNTKLYQTLYYGTQVSDFVARYTLYQHLVNRKELPLSHEQAIQKASDYFVNYDLPSGRKLQWLNDHGFVMFTKYYIRIQKVILELYRENPGRALAMMLIGNYFDNLPLLSESSAITHPHNPLSDGAFKYFEVLNDLATLKMGAALVR